MSESPSPAEAGRSIRDELLAAQAEINARIEPDEPEPKEEPKEERPRDPSGRFATEEKEPRSESPAPAPIAEVAPEPASSDFTPAPQAWKNEEKALWSKIPPEAQKAILRREQDAHRGITMRDEDTNLGRQFKQLAQPYEPLFQQLGAHPIQGFQDYLRIMHTLITGDPESKRQILQQAAVRYGAANGEQPNTDAGLPPAVMQTISQLASQQQQQARDLNAWKAQQQQAEMATTMSEIERFAKDSSHPYFESVREHMATLITAGAATSLADAYEQAVWARPDTREKLMAAQAAPLLRQEQSRAKTERARAKAGSIKGGSGATPEPTRNPNATVREDLLAAMEEARGRI